jgi:hypothetical protein
LLISFFLSFCPFLFSFSLVSHSLLPFSLYLFSIMILSVKLLLTWSNDNQTREFPPSASYPSSIPPFIVTKEIFPY